MNRPRPHPVGEKGRGKVWQSSMNPTETWPREGWIGNDNRQNAKLFDSLWSFLAPDPRPVVEMMGFEPMTPCLQGRCSPSWATPPYCCLRQWYCFAVILLRSDIASQCYALGMGFCFFSKRSFKIEQRIETVLFTKPSFYVAYILVMHGRFSIERRWSSRTFRYGYLVTT